jgi:hypothetical protein
MCGGSRARSVGAQGHVRRGASMSSELPRAWGSRLAPPFPRRQPATGRAFLQQGEDGRQIPADGRLAHPQLPGNGGLAAIGPAECSQQFQHLTASHGSPQLAESIVLVPSRRASFDLVPRGRLTPVFSEPLHAFARDAYIVPSLCAKATRGASRAGEEVAIRRQAWRPISPPARIWMSRRSARQGQRAGALRGGLVCGRRVLDVSTTISTPQRYWGRRPPRDV